MYNQLYSGSAATQGLSAKTIKNIHGVLHKALNQAVTNGYIPNNPSDGCVLPRVIKKEITPLSDDEIKKFLMAIETDKFSDIFFVTLFTGMRQREVLGLMWKDIDFEQGKIVIRQQLQKEKRIPESRFHDLRHSYAVIALQNGDDNKNGAINNLRTSHCCIYT